MNRKSKRNLIVLLVLIVVLLIVFLFLKKNEDADFMREEVSTEEESVPVVNINKDEVTDIEFIRSDGSYTLHKDGDVWNYLEDVDTGTTRKVDQDTVSTYLDNICALTAKQEITDVTDFPDYGISEESDSVTLQLANDLYVFRIGDYNSLAAGYYLTVNDGSSVYLIDSSTYYLLHKDSSYFEDTSEEESTEENSEVSSEEGSETEGVEAESTEAESAETEGIEAEGTETESTITENAGEEDAEASNTEAENVE